MLTSPIGLLPKKQESLEEVLKLGTRREGKQA